MCVAATVLAAGWIASATLDTQPADAGLLSPTPPAAANAAPFKELAIASSDIVQAVEILNSSYQHVATISRGIDFPEDAVYDASGNLYVANGAAGNVTEYSSTRRLVFTYSIGSRTPWSVAVDANGNVYVGDGNGGVTEFAQRRNQPIASCSTSLANYGITVDSRNGSVFVTGTQGSFSYMLEFRRGLTGCHLTTLGAQLPATAAGLVLDKHNDLVTADSSSVDILAPPYTSIASNISAFDPVALALNKSNGLIFVVEGSGDVLVDAYPSGTNVTTLGVSSGILAASAVAAFPPQP